MTIFNDLDFCKIELDSANNLKVTAYDVTPENTEGVNITVVKISECLNEEILYIQAGTQEYHTMVFEGLVLENKIKNIPLSLDGVYFIRIRNYDSTEERTISFTTYNHVINSLLTKTQKLFCGCNFCDTITDIFKKSYEKELDVLLSYVMLFSLLEKCYNLKCLNCKFEELLNCDYINENFKDINKLNINKSNLIIANLFNSLSLYLEEVGNDSFESQINIIKRCIIKNNIHIEDCIEEDEIPVENKCTSLTTIIAAYGGVVEHTMEAVFTFTTCDNEQVVINHLFVPGTDSEVLEVNQCIKDSTLTIRNAATVITEPVNDYEDIFTYAFPDEGAWEIRFLTEACNTAPIS